MNTKSYKKLIKYSLDHGQIPHDLYDLVMAEIERDGKMTPRVYALYLDELERRRLFYTDGTPFNDDVVAKTDGTYKYLHTKNPFWYIAHAFYSTVFKAIGYLVGGIGYGIWRIKDRKKIKKIGACVSISNHIGFIDAAITRRAFGCKKQYIVAAPHNCKPNFGGHILRSATVLPLPIAFRGVKPFCEALEYVRDHKGAIHFYAEQSLWLHYEKPRPFKDGAFHYADRLDVPVVPMLYCFKKPRGLRKLFKMPKVVVKIADPIYADKALPTRERQIDLARRTKEAVDGLYEQFYGKPMEYLPQKPSGFDEPTAEADSSDGKE